MSLEKLNSFLERFKKITPPDSSVRKEVSKVIKEIGLDVSIEDISIDRNGVVFVKKEGHIKNKIFIKKEEIKKRANEALGKELIKDIR
jgi:hypothetical protein